MTAERNRCVRFRRIGRCAPGRERFGIGVDSRAVENGAGGNSGGRRRRKQRVARIESECARVAAGRVSPRGTRRPTVPRTFSAAISEASGRDAVPSDENAELSLPSVRDERKLLPVRSRWIRKRFAQGLIIRKEGALAGRRRKKVNLAKISPSARLERGEGRGGRDVFSSLNRDD